MRGREGSFAPAPANGSQVDDALAQADAKLALSSAPRILLLTSTQGLGEVWAKVAVVSPKGSAGAGTTAKVEPTLDGSSMGATPPRRDEGELHSRASMAGCAATGLPKRARELRRRRPALS